MEVFCSALARLQLVVNQRPNEIWNSERKRSELLQSSKEVITSLQKPGDVLAELALAPVHYAFLRIAIDLDLFQKLVVAAPNAVTSKQLAEQCDGADEELIKRIGRSLVVIGFANPGETAGTFVANRITEYMLLSNTKAGMRFYFDQMFPILIHAPVYFKHNGYQLPTGKSDGVFQSAHKTEDDSYTFWSKQPGVMENFNAFAQGGYFGAVAAHFKQSDWFPYDKVCLDDFDIQKGEYNLVDVGGNKGYQIRDALDKYSDAKGRFVLQDLPQVIEDIENSGEKLNPRIEKMRYDFFKPQPIKGARAYMFNNILHNWANSRCHEILTNVREAMTPGYSRLLIGEIIMPEKNIPSVMVGVDATMLMGFSGAERDPGEWKRLIEKAGLKVIKFWHASGPGNGVIEVERPA